MVRFIATMLIPLWVLVYTIAFGRWVRSKKNNVGAVAAFVIAAAAFLTSTWVLWRMAHL